MKTTDILATFPAILTRKAAECGVDVSGVKMETITTDRTWGDRCGFVFHGAEMPVLERVAAYFEKWIRRNATTGSYEAQRSIGLAGVYTYMGFNNGAKDWIQGAHAKPATRTLSHGFELACVDHKVGVAVSTTYYPCAD